jgi:hypothetical protein
MQGRRAQEREAILQGDADAIERRRLANERRRTRRWAQARLKAAGRGSNDDEDGTGNEGPGPGPSAGALAARSRRARETGEEKAARLKDSRDRQRRLRGDKLWRAQERQTDKLRRRVARMPSASRAEGEGAVLLLGLGAS